MWEVRCCNATACAQEILRTNPHVLRPFVRVVVLDLVVVPRHQAGRRRMKRLQVGIGSVEGVAVAVADKVGRCGAIVLAHGAVSIGRRDRVLVEPRNSTRSPHVEGKWMLRTANERLLAALEVLFATRRNRIFLAVAAVVIPLVVILILLEISYRAETAQESSPMFTGSLPSAPFGAPKIQFEPRDAPWTPLGPPIFPFASPTPWAVARPSPAEPSQMPRHPVPFSAFTAEAAFKCAGSSGKAVQHCASRSASSIRAETLADLARLLAQSVPWRLPPAPHGAMKSHGGQNPLRVNELIPQRWSQYEKENEAS